MEITVKKRFLRIAPRKVRLLGDLIKGMGVEKALNQLKFSSKRAAGPVLKLLLSAIAAAKEKNIKEDILYVKLVNVDEGPKLKRRRLKSRGRSTGINKRMSHISLLISEKKTIEGKNDSKDKQKKNKKE